ncbi:hypothetical protein CFE70_001219 [Pyrenophora teres f. teres 0-1]
MTTTPIHSTGRGGAGNIGPDTSIYTDGGLVREGIQGESADGEFSTGRGGAGNIGQSPRVGPQSDDGRRRSVDLVPEINQRNAQDEFHTGRKGLGEKVKQALHLDKKKEHETSPLAKNQTTI